MVISPFYGEFFTARLCFFCRKFEFTRICGKEHFSMLFASVHWQIFFEKKF